MVINEGKAMVKLTKIMTRTGDDGQTGLVGGERVAKTSWRIEVIGSIDELNCHCGLIAAAMRADPRLSELSGAMVRIQQQLFDLGAELACPRPVDAIPTIKETAIQSLEKEVEAMNALLEPLRSFVLPGGGEVVARIHLARAVCRRAERALWHLASGESVSDAVLRYTNRLSDWLFVLARVAAKTCEEPEELWDSRRHHSKK